MNINALQKNKTNALNRTDIWGNIISKKTRTHKISFADNALSKKTDTKLIDVHLVKCLKAHNAKFTHQVKNSAILVEEDEGQSCCCSMF